MTTIASRNFSRDSYRLLVSQGYSPTLARIYASRGICNSTDLKSTFTELLPYTALLNAEVAAKLLCTAIKCHKRLLIVADFDADGATACAVGIRGLRQLGACVDYIVPNRFEFGYGLSPEIVKLAAQSKPDLLITVDNGIASVEGIAAANRLGIVVLVTDHHLPGDALPNALCIVNPNQHDCEFPSKNLAGVGVIFYTLLALRAEMRLQGHFANHAEPNLANLLDLVALGTIADVVKLDQNNRILVKQGMERIKSGRCCAGIRALIAVAKKEIPTLSTQDLGFSLAPRLNAAGRLRDMRLGIECLLTDDISKAHEIAKELDELNRERRSIESNMRESALSLLEDRNASDIDDFTILNGANVASESPRYSVTMFNAAWHQGVIGILASRIKDQFHRPTIMFADSGNGELKGSGRSVAGFHLRDALDLVSKRHSKLIKTFGGHAAAAGLTISRNSLDEFVAAFEQVAREQLTEVDLSTLIETDGEIDSNELTVEFADLLNSEVWGQGFPAPLFRATFDVVSQRVVGEKHLKLKLGVHGNVHDAILFGHDQPLPTQINAAYSLSINEYNGSRKLQLILRHWEQLQG